MIVGIICEYNPFHNGHQYQIDKIREELGEDTVIVALMSGNYTQRGETAIAEKGLRAKCAVQCGINLVLELPFPYSMSSAEFFASSSVHILNSLGCIDVLSFGSESGDISQLEAVSDIMITDSYEKLRKEYTSNIKYKKYGYPQICELALRDLCGEFLDFKFTPNNILALEYIKALKLSKSNIKPHTIERCSSRFDDETIISGNLQSGMAIRNAISSNDISALEYIPDITKKYFLSAIENGDFPCNINRLSTAIISFFRLSSSCASEDFHDAKGGLYNRLKDLSYKNNDLENLVKSAETKKFTQARIRRAILNSYLGVTSSQITKMPLYTQLLATDNFGRSVLNKISTQSEFPVLTKPSDVSGLSCDAIQQKDLSDKADSIFELTKPIPKDGNYALRFTPFVKK